MQDINKKKTFAAAAMFSAAAITVASVYTILHTGTGVSQLVAWQAMPAGFHVIKKQVARLWPCLPVRLKLVKKENCHANQ
jgi:hypothetical protein